ncbi:MAG: amidohydrolase family protein [Halieaceae bacterium]|nr:amidohydrolase family protein [Halieaceae bacterium]
MGGLPPDVLVESEDAILADSERLIWTFHDASPASKLTIGLAPCSPFSVSRELMTASAEQARRHGVRLHTHLAENVEDLRYSRERFNCTPGERDVLPEPRALPPRSTDRRSRARHRSYRSCS